MLYSYPFILDVFNETFGLSKDPYTKYVLEDNVMRIDAPGLDDIQVNLDGKQLTLTLKRGTKEYIRYYTLSNDIDRDKIAVTYKRGVIEVSLPKKLPDKRDGPVSIPVTIE